MRRRAWIAALLSLLAMFAFMAQASAAVRPGSPAVSSSDPFNIKNSSGRCIGIAPGQYYAGLWNCVSHPDQRWRTGATIGAYTQLINGNNKCLGVAGGSGSEGARIVAWSCAGDPSNQFWDLVTYPPTYTTGYLVNYHSRLVVGVAGGSTSNGAELVQWRELAHPDQYWTFP
jgi:hypothetical protein